MKQRLRKVEEAADDMKQQLRKAEQTADEMKRQVGDMSGELSESGAAQAIGHCAVSTRRGPLHSTTESMKHQLVLPSKVHGTHQPRDHLGP